MVGLNLLVIGATGIIGRHVCEEATRQGHRVTAISRGVRPPVGIDPVELIVGDARDPDAMQELLRDRSFDATIDLLSFSPAQLDSTLSWAAGRSGQYVFVSSATVFNGAPPGIALTEASEVRTSGWSYPLLKVESERKLRERALDLALNFTIVRPYITYSEQRLAFGAWEGEQVLSRLRRGQPVVIGEEIAEARTSVTHAADFARAITSLLGNQRAMNNDFTVADDRTLRWIDVFERTATILGAKLVIASAPASSIARVFPELDGKVGDRVLDREFDVSRLREASPSFDFEISMAQGYERILESWRAPWRPGSQWQGKMARLVATAGERPVGAFSDVKGIKGRVGYVIGRSAALTAASDALRRQRPSEYL